MAKVKADLWTKERERGSFWAMRSLAFLYRFGGRFLIAPIVYVTVTYFFLTSSEKRRYSKSYLLKVAECTDQFNPSNVGLIMIWRHYLEFANALVNRISAWMGLTHYSDVEFPERDALMAEQGKNQGSIILGAHFGNMDMCRALVAENRSLKMNVVVNIQETENFNRLLQGLNPDLGVNLISMNNIDPSTAITIKEKLDAGESLVMFSDRVSPGSESRSIKKEFLGVDTYFPEGPFRLAIRMDCPVYFMTCIRDSGKFKMKFICLWDGVSRGKRSENIAYLLTQYVQCLSDLCKQYPLNWFNFYDYWSEFTLKNKK